MNPSYSTRASSKSVLERWAQRRIWKVSCFDGRHEIHLESLIGLNQRTIEDENLTVPKLKEGGVKATVRVYSEGDEVFEKSD